MGSPLDQVEVLISNAQKRHCWVSFPYTPRLFAKTPLIKLKSCVKTKENDDNTK